MPDTYFRTREARKHTALYESWHGAKRCEECNSSIAYDRAAAGAKLCSQCEKAAKEEREKRKLLRWRKKRREEFLAGTAGEGLKSRRKRAGLSQKRLAGLATISEGTLRNIEAGLAEPREETRRLLDAALAAHGEDGLMLQERIRRLEQAERAAVMSRRWKEATRYMEERVRLQEVYRRGHLLETLPVNPEGRVNQLSSTRS